MSRLIEGIIFLLTRPSRDVTLVKAAIEYTRSFLLTRPSRDVTKPPGRGSVACEFLLTRPSRDVTCHFQERFINDVISTHTSLAGRDFVSGMKKPRIFAFQLTRPSRDVTAVIPPSALVSTISTHTSLAGRDGFRVCIFAGQVAISTHTSLAGRDTGGNVELTTEEDFYSHVPRGT